MRLQASIKKVRNIVALSEARLLMMALLVFVVLLGIFYPGYMSADSLHQLRQAQGLLPLTDWHPVSMTLLWRALISVTGQVGSFVVLQLALLCMALFGMALYVYRVTRRLDFALWVYALAAFPGVLTIAGVAWKDVSMAFALLLASVLFLIALICTHMRRNVVLCVVLATVLLIYAGTLRYNAMLAAIPLFAMIPYVISIRVSKRVVFAAIVSGVGLIALVGYILAPYVQTTYPVTAIMLDDIVHVAPAEGSAITRPVYTHIQSVCELSTPEILNSYVLCTTEDERTFIREHHNQISADWLHAVASHPLKYLRYRMATFAIFLFPDTNRMYIYQNGIIDNELGVATNQYTTYALGAFINGFAKTNLPFIFQPWFWLVALLLIIYHVRKQKPSKERVLIRVVALSGILYGLGYSVATVATDYRYGYWMALAALFCVVTLCALRLRRQGAQIVR